MKFSDYKNLTIQNRINWKTKNLFSFDNPFNKCFKNFDLNIYLTKNK